MDADAVRERAAELPREPGVYQFIERADPDSGEPDRQSPEIALARDPSESADGSPEPARRSADAEGGRASRDGDATLYVGKAVDLRDRVRSYADPRSERIARMVERADRIEVAVTDTETQALLLEANLIKRHAPRYNVRLRDDKSYPLVQLTDHEFPRIEVTRDPDAGATAFGPFTDKGRVETVVKALREAYGVRGCSDHKFAGRDRPCLDHEMGLCSGPCVEDTEIDREGYLADVEAAERFLGGETDLLAAPLRREMDRAAQEAAFERAANLRDRLEAVEAFHEGAGEVVRDAGDERRVDVLGAAVEGREATVARLQAEDGQLVDRTRHRLAAPADGEDRLADVVGAFVAQYYAERDLPGALLLPVWPDDDELVGWLEREGVAVRVPGAGREARLVDLALKNARRNAGGADEAAALADALGLDRPDRIEGFDVSHAGGRAVVGSNVVFVDGSPEKAGYRRKKLPEGNDDYAGMRALVRWRADRAVEGRDDRPDPDLLVVDGGAGQLAAAREALAAAGWAVPVVALAKAEEIVHAPAGDLAVHEGSNASTESSTATGANVSTGSNAPTGSGTSAGTDTHDWPADAPQLHLLQRVRDEAHRFARQYHETLRDEVSTALEDVPGVGPETRRRLLRRFGSVEGVRAASTEELQSVPGIGPETAATIERKL